MGCPITYILSRSRTSAKEEKASPMEILTKRAPDLRDIVVFGSVCSVYRDPRKNSLAKRSQVGIIIGRSDEIKGYKVFLQKENKVVVTQHLKDIETLSDEQNSHMQNALDFRMRYSHATRDTSTRRKQSLAVGQARPQH